MSIAAVDANLKNDEELLHWIGAHNPMNLPIITSDWDDVISEKTLSFSSRAAFFRLVSVVSCFFIVTSRPMDSLGGMSSNDSIETQIGQLGLNVAGIVANAGNKSRVLDIANPLAHFEDDPETIIECIRKGHNVWHTGEMMDPNHVQKWMDVITEDGLKQYYPASRFA